MTTFGANRGSKLSEEDAAPVTTDLSQQLQRTLGAAYVIERELGGGGMSRVFLARETALDRRVVIKVLPPELSASVSVERFRREIQLAAGLQHPHIVPVLTAGISDGLPYFTMPFVDGESLRARLAREHELTVGDTVSILRDVAKALALRARARRRAPRHQAGQRAPLRRLGGRDRLRRREGALGVHRAGELGADVARHRDRDAGVHGARAGGGGPGHRPPRRPLRARRDGVRDAHRAAALPRPLAAAGARRAHDADAGADRSGCGPRSRRRWRRSSCAASRSTRRTGRRTPTSCCRRSMRSRRRAAAARRRCRWRRARSSRRRVGCSSDARSAAYAAASVAVVAFAALLVQALGVPDWVFPGAAIVMAMGLPMVLITGYRAARGPRRAPHRRRAPDLHLAAHRDRRRRGARRVRARSWPDGR